MVKRTSKVSQVLIRTLQDQGVTGTVNLLGLSTKEIAIIAEEIGPRTVGRTYHNTWANATYTVEGIKIERNIAGSVVWGVTEQAAGIRYTHATRWDSAHERGLQ